MPGEFTDRIAEVDAYAAQPRQLIPDVTRAFGGLSKAAQTPGVLDGKTKELIALALSVATNCKGCIAYHARNAVRTGATRQEVAEALGVAIQMGGGPGITIAADALRAYDEFATTAKQAEA